MTGLLLKDFLLLKKQYFILIGLLVFYTAFAIYNEDISMFAYMSVLFAFYMPLNSFAYDERCQWNKYALSAPIKASTLVYSKYIFSLICIAVCSLLSLVLSLFLDKGLHLDSIKTILYAASLGIGIISVFLPFCFKLGVEKSRYVLLPICMIPSIIGILLSKTNITFVPTKAMIDLIIALLPVLILVLLFLSILISKRIMEHKEY